MKIPLVELFKTPNIRALAEYAQGADKIDYSAVEPIEKKEYYALSSAQKRLYFLQQWFSLSDEAVEDAMYDMPLFRDFVGAAVEYQSGKVTTAV